MNSSLYIGATGMKGLADGMSVTTNNLANVSTIGFKKQDILFSDVIYQTQASMGNWWNAQEDSRVAIGQVGQGLQIEAVRTKYTQGGLESSNTMTDMAINGKGFFQVSDGQKTYYTRAGDFRADQNGVWRTPTGYALNGYKLNDDGSRGDLTAVQVDKFQTMAPKATSSLDITMNLRPGENRSVDSDNPYFALLNQYDGKASTPLNQDAYTTSQSMTLYDSDGNAHTVTAYFDGAPAGRGTKAMEFILASAADTEAETREVGDGLLMSGVLQFDDKGNLINIAAFTPSVAGSKNLEDWVPANMQNGSPTLSIEGQQIAVNFGLSGSGGWDSAPVNAAAVGTDVNLLPSLGEGATSSAYPTTAFNSSAYANSYKQNGYAEGVLSNISISSSGIISGQFSNGQVQDLWQIPVARFTSEDGLRREGGNMFSATEASGQMELGTAGEENYGEINAYNLENSNVDLAQEMVSMIINQRGFQSNSKVVTTADQMLQKAMEIKRH